MKYKIFCSLFLTVIFFSCGAGDVSRVEIRDSQNFDAPCTKVWETALSIMARDIYVVKTISEQKLMVQYEYEQIPKDSIYSYTTTQGGKYIAAARSVFIQVKGDSAKSTVFVSTAYEGIWEELNLIDIVNKGVQKLFSNGKFESEFFAKLEKELQKN